MISTYTNKYTNWQNKMVYKLGINQSSINHDEHLTYHRNILKLANDNK